ncbi:amino acid permease/ SLC12A domain-containing protein [Stachybotrys elegans]|uniref:Amino acid permease/ SLC12A domain-containing protein n=1 Tax=Stachybotrys elegans TaxID=80388 RepID=A0A8K0SYQ6_9HYPO|nr:amino acid permease/ SLC12A domain-containing protein [Stachybotrys elegans]
MEKLSGQDDVQDKSSLSDRNLQNVISLEHGTQHAVNNESLHRGFKPRHSQMIALGGAIGTSIFIGTAQVLRIGGPLFLVLGYSFLCILVYLIMTGLAEIAAYLPVQGGTMSFYGSKYISRSMGFALGYLYWYSLGILIPYELVASTLLIDYWGSTSVSPAVFVTAILVVIVLVNFLPVQYFGETEFWAAGMKVVLIVGLCFLSFILFLGGGPNHDRIGFRYWQHPGPTNTYLAEGDAGRFVALLQCVVLGSFAFVLAPEYVIVTAGEMESPRSNVPRAAQRYIWRFIILFIPTVLSISVLVPYDDERLAASGTARSPFVIAIKEAGIPVLDSIVNSMIMLSAITAGNSFLYQSSRNLYSLAVTGDAPAIFKRTNKHGLPWVAVLASTAFTPLAYLSLGSTSLTVFNWLINITNTSGFVSWICCGWIYNRFRKAVEHHGVEVPYRSPFQPYGIYFGGITSVFLLFLNGFTVFFPDKWAVGDFLSAYIGIPVFLVIYLGHRVYARQDPWARNTAEIDMFAGLDEVLAAEKPRRTRGAIGRVLFALIE